MPRVAEKVRSVWRLVEQRFDLSKKPHVLELRLEADRGAEFPCPVCGRMCKPHDFKEFTWRHLNFFQHHCAITTKVPRTKCPEHGVKRTEVPWAREGSRFTKLFEAAAMTLVREMPVKTAARIMETTDQRIWRVVAYYVSRAVSGLDLSDLEAFAFDETASKRGHNYVTVFIDLNRANEPVVFATPGKGKETVTRFKEFLEEHGGKTGNIVEVVCDMSKAFLAAVGETFEDSSVTVDWFHVVQKFTDALDAVRKAESKEVKLPNATRWAVLKAKESRLTPKQVGALIELEAGDFLTAVAWRIKEKLRWVRGAKTRRAARWRLTHFIRHGRERIGDDPAFEAVRKAIETVERHFERIIQRWTSTHTNARLEALNGLFQAARARARGYRNTATFITMIYLIAAPLGNLINSI